MEPEKLLREMFDAAVAAGAPERCVPAHLPEPPAEGRTVVVGAGKAAAAMAKAVEDNWKGDALSGVVVTRYGHAEGIRCERIEVVEAGHPVPDEAGVEAARRILEAVSGLGEDDLVLCLVSGGGSALLTLPAEGLGLEDQQEAGKALAKAGASIVELNAVRKHISGIKGGRLARAAAPARVVTLIMSDVPGDDPAVIASGPTVPDPSTFEDARRVLKKYGVDGPKAVVEHLRAARDETPKPGDPAFERVENVLVATAQDSLEAAAEVARRAGVEPVILSDCVEGESRDVAKVLAAIARQVRRHGQPACAPAVLLSGGETTVTVRGEGRGGPNTEFALGLAVALGGLEGVHAVACDTDGIDGTEDNAGAFVAPDTLRRAEEASVDAADRLADNDGYGFFAAIDDLVRTGPTQTNIKDFRALLVLDGGDGRPGRG